MLNLQRLKNRKNEVDWVIRGRNRTTSEDKNIY